MSGKELTIEIINKLNNIQTKYNPTNYKFELKEYNDTDKKQIYAKIVHYNHDEEIIVVNALIYYKEYDDTVHKLLYEELNSSLFNKLLFTNIFKNTIATIDLLK
jgi:hypothetical protein